MATTTEERNKELMQTLDDAWNAQDVEVFRQRHKPDVIVRWPGQPEPTVGIEDHTPSRSRSGRLSPTRSSTTGRTRCSLPTATGRPRSHVFAAR
jgi:hypothetical protein